MRDVDVENFEIDQLTEAIFFRYGYDFRSYARASLRRRIEYRVKQSGLTSISDMIPQVMHDKGFFDLFLKDMSVTVTEMFRDPFVFRQLKNSVFDYLRTYPRINIWHAGCATGEEAYSIAIMLKEAGLLDKTQIYATDYNNHSLEIAKKGIYPIEKMKLFTENYLAAGGEESFSDYYQAKYQSAKIDESLKENITFANHNLVKDGVFAQMHIVLCRNVLIYFGKDLQNHVLKLLKESLIPRGFMVLGDKESLRFTSIEDSFELFSDKEKIYRKNNDV